MKIKIRNFQSIERADVEVRGFTVITGRSNVGKTAFVRACQAIFFGIPGDYFIRYGQNFCGVAVTDNDLELVWRKTSKPDPKKPTALQVNGVVHTKIGKDHLRLTEPVGVVELQTSQARIRPQFAMQHDNIFMLSESETTIAEILKLLGRIDVVTTAQRNAKRDLSSTASKRKIRVSDLEESEGKLRALDYVAGLRKEFIGVEARVLTMEMQNQRREELIVKTKRWQELEPQSVPELPATLSIGKIYVLEQLRKFKSLKLRTVPDLPGLVLFPEERSRNAGKLGLLIETEFQLEKLVEQKQTLSSDITEVEEAKVLVESLLEACPTCDRPFEEGHDH